MCAARAHWPVRRQGTMPGTTPCQEQPWMTMQSRAVCRHLEAGASIWRRLIRVACFLWRSQVHPRRHATFLVSEDPGAVQRVWRVASVLRGGLMPHPWDHGGAPAPSDSLDREDTLRRSSAPQTRRLGRVLEVPIRPTAGHVAWTCPAIPQSDRLRWRNSQT